MAAELGRMAGVLAAVTLGASISVVQTSMAQDQGYTPKFNDAGELLLELCQKVGDGDIRRRVWLA